MDMSTKKAGTALICVALIITLVMGDCNGSALALPVDITPTLGVDYSVAVGEIMQLGGIDWRVLEVKDGKALILSDKILFNMAYHSPPGWGGTATYAVTWEECDLRQYLNGQFYDSTFSAKEKKRIVEMPIVNSNNPWYGTSGGNDTLDKIFLLSIEEMMQYFGVSSEEMENPEIGATFLNDRFNVWRIAEKQDGEASWWWFRSPGGNFLLCGGLHVLATSATAAGGICIQGEYVSNKHGGVRPALWVRL